MTKSPTATKSYTIQSFEENDEDSGEEILPEDINWIAILPSPLLTEEQINELETDN